MLPISGNRLRSGIDRWLDKLRIYPRIVDEFDDSALMKVFGQEDAGIFIAPAAIESEVESQYDAKCIGRSTDVREEFYTISVERRISHPVVAMIMETARESLFTKT